MASNKTHTINVVHTIVVLILFSYVSLYISVSLKLIFDAESNYLFVKVMEATQHYTVQDTTVLTGRNSRLVIMAEGG